MRASHLWTTAFSGNELRKFLINMLSTSYLKARLSVPSRRSNRAHDPRGSYSGRDYNVQNESNLHLALRLRGGSGGTSTSSGRQPPQGTSIDKAVEARSRANKLDKALDELETGITLAQDVEDKLTKCTCVKEKMLAVTNACVVILRPACGPLAKILGVSACEFRPDRGYPPSHQRSA